VKTNASFRLFAASGAIALGLALSGCGGAAAPAGPAMPDFTLSSLEGATVEKGSLAGRVVLYDFWATWCGPCHLQADILREAQPDLQAAGAEIVGIATGEEAEVVRDFAAKRPFPWRVLLDPEEKVSNHLEVIGLPTTVITCKSGPISFRQTGIVDSGRLEREVAKAQSC
jgi:peroxiredoxin